MAQGGKGYPKINIHMKNKKKHPKNQTKKNKCFETWGDFLKKSRVQRLDVYCGIMKNNDKNVVSKIVQKENSKNLT